jgi:transcriptional regulator with XRE-family HTH domain
LTKRGSTYRPSPETLVEDFATNLRDYRLRANLTQAALSPLAKIAQTDISQIERGERNVTLQTIARFATALDIDPRNLLKPAKRTPKPSK